MAAALVLVTLPVRRISKSVESVRRISKSVESRDGVLRRAKRDARREAATDLEVRRTGVL